MFTFRETRILAGDGLRLAVYSWERKDSPDAPLCLILHGMAEYGLRYRRFVEDLRDTGWAFAAWDMRGHGYSEGERMRMASIQEPLSDLRLTLQFIRGPLQRKRQVVLLGHSFGGLVAVLYAALHPEDVSGLILSSPALGIYPLVPFTEKIIECAHRLIPNQVIPKPVRPDKLSSDPLVRESYLSDAHIYKFTGVDFLYSMLQGMRFVEKHVTQISASLLMILGGKDEIVDNRKNIAFFNRVNGSIKEIQIFEGFLHETFNELRRAQSVARVRRFLLERHKMSSSNGRAFQ